MGGGEERNAHLSMNAKQEAFKVTERQEPNESDDRAYSYGVRAHQGSDIAAHLHE